jgi:uncharacterized membrane protein YphA (DoxX/SURF4 family)
MKKQNTKTKDNFLKRTAGKFQILFHPALQIPIRLIVGLLLIYFSINKINDPQKWAEVIYQYRLVPFGLVNIVSIIFSWGELFAGVGILLGIMTRASSLVASGLVFAYLSAIQINIWREVYIYCGCFRKQAYLTDVTYMNRNITFYVLVLTIILILNKKHKLELDSVIEKIFGKSKAG